MNMTNKRLNQTLLVADDKTSKFADSREELYRTLARSIPHTAVVLFDRDFRYTLAEGVLLEKHGFSQEMFEGKTFREVFPQEVSE